jgi:hypothetical protein
MKRSAAVWMADAMAKTVREWRGIQEVSWRDSSGEAERKVARTKKSLGDLPMAALGKVISIPVAIGAFGFSVGASLSATFQSDRDAAQTGRLISAVNELPAWIASGALISKNPFTVAKTVERLLPNAIANKENSLMQKALFGFDADMEDYMRRQQDSLVLRGVGTIRDIASRAGQNPDIAFARAKFAASAKNSVDWEALRKQLTNQIAGKDK